MTRFGQFLANKQNCISTFKKSQNVGARQVLWAFGGFRVGGAPCWNKLALSQNLKNLHLNFLALPVTYFATNLVYHFTLRVTGIKNTLEQVTPHYTKISLLSTNCLAFIQEIRQAGEQSTDLVRKFLLCLIAKSAQGNITIRRMYKALHFMAANIFYQLYSYMVLMP